MSENPSSNPPAVPEIKARLQEVARLLRRSGSLEPDARRNLAELVEELGRTLETAAVPPAEVAHLAESTAALAETLHHEQDAGILERSRDHLERAVSSAEAFAPVTVGVARRLLETLANLGI